MAATARGNKGLNALFDRVFDEPAMKNAVNNLHEDSIQQTDALEEITHPTGAPHSVGSPVDPVRIHKKTPPPPKQTPISTTISTTVKASNQIGKQASKPSTEQVAKQASELANGLATNQVSKQAEQQPDKQVEHQPTRQPLRQADQQLFRQPEQQPLKQPSSIKCVEEDFLSLTKNQSSILLYLYNAGGLTSMEQICGDTGIAYGTARSALLILQREGYVTGKKQFNGHTFRGFSFTLNNNLCQLYFNRLFQQPIQQPIEQTVHQVAQRPLQQATGQASKQADNPIEEVEVKENLLTSSKTVISGIDLEGAELGWWVSIGLTVAKTAEWLREFSGAGLTSQDLSNSLKYAWFDAAINRIQPAGRPIDNYFNWFYKYLPGGYPAPGNYKSYTQVLIEKERLELAEIEREKNELVEIRRRKQEAQKELIFQKLLLDTESKEYQALYEKVSDFAKEEGDEALMFALRDAFFESENVQKSY